MAWAMLLWSVLSVVFPNARIGLCEWPVFVTTIYATFLLQGYVFLAVPTLIISVALVISWFKLYLAAWVLVLFGHVFLYLAVSKSPFDHLGELFRNHARAAIVASACCIAALLGGIERNLLGVFVLLTYLLFMVAWALWMKHEPSRKFSVLVILTAGAHTIQTFLALVTQSLLPPSIIGTPTLVWYSIVVFVLGAKAIHVKKVSEQTVV